MKRKVGKMYSKHRDTEYDFQTKEKTRNITHYKLCYSEVCVECLTLTILQIEIPCFGLI